MGEDKSGEVCCSLWVVEWEWGVDLGWTSAWLGARARGGGRVFERATVCAARRRGWTVPLQRVLAGAVCATSGLQNVAGWGVGVVELGDAMALTLILRRLRESLPHRPRELGEGSSTRRVHGLEKWNREPRWLGPKDGFGPIQMSRGMRRCSCRAAVLLAPAPAPGQDPARIRRTSDKVPGRFATRKVSSYSLRVDGVDVGLGI